MKLPKPKSHPLGQKRAPQRAPKLAEVKAVYTSRDERLQVERAAKANDFRSKLPAAAVYVVTSCQNATEIHDGFFGALRTYCKYHGAELVIIPYRYRNPTRPEDSGEKCDDEWWPKAVMPHTFAGRYRLNKHVQIFGDLKMQPTRMNPLASLEALSMSESCVFGHPKVHLKSVPTQHSHLPKLLTTTGCLNRPNYSDTTTGKIAAFHRTLGATIIEIDGDCFHLRQINGDKNTGAFTDLDKVYTADGVADAPRPFALVLGDAHVDFFDPDVERATFGPRGILSTLNPRHIVWHDLLDGYSVNPHHDGNPFNAIAKYRAGMHEAKAEVKRACEFVKAHTPDGIKSVVVASNHDDFLLRWIKSTDWRRDPANAEFYLETALDMVRATSMGDGGAEYPDPFVLWARQLMPDVRMLTRGDTFNYRGVELAMHGDRGPNGARGSIRNLRRIGVKSIVGHTHAPGIDEGCMQVGTSSRLKLEYNDGPSGWLNSHGVLYADGKRSLIHVIDGRWRA